MGELGGGEGLSFSLSLINTHARTHTKVWIVFLKATYRFVQRRNGSCLTRSMKVDSSLFTLCGCARARSHAHIHPCARIRVDGAAVVEGLYFSLFFSLHLHESLTFYTCLCVHVHVRARWPVNVGSGGGRVRGAEPSALRLAPG